LTPILGWLPVEIGFDAQAALVADASVRWLEAGSTPLAEPFLRDTADKLRKASPPPREVETNLDALFRLAGLLPDATPRGFIFHMSRCGSTLIANAIRTAAGVTVVCEALPVTRLLLPGAQPPGSWHAARWDGYRRRVLQSMFNVFAHYRTGEPDALVIKFASIDLLGMQFVRKLWPGVPCIVAVRDPAEVIVANLPGGVLMTLKQQPELSTRVLGWSGAGMTDEDFYARGLGLILEAALGALDDGCKVVDYGDLNAARMREIAGFLGVELPPDPGQVDRVFRVYSKDPSGRMQFHDDRPAKQKSITAAIRNAAQTWAMPAYSEIRERGVR
jgi:hypothetical protein